MSQQPEDPSASIMLPARGSCIHEQIQRHAAATPTAVAVTCDGTSLTYGELNDRANGIAHRLRGLGVGPESLVAVSLERSLEMVVGLLAILKSGGAYLPIDPTYPAEHIKFLLDDAQPVALLSSSRVRGLLPASDIPALILDELLADFHAEQSDDPAPLANEQSLAYVIYTSGSTGRPKGCQITHANVTRLCTETQGWFKFGPSDVWSFFHSHAFDFSVWEIWGALVHGGRVVVVPYLTSRSPELFHALLVREGVTVLNQTPSAFKGLVHADQTSDRPPSALALRYVIFGGEALELQTLRPWFERHGDQHPRLINMYGITETTVHVTYRPICLADLKSNAGSMIGRPIPDLQLVLLDAERRPVAIGDVGEIHVAGAGVCRGYLNRPELTAERFFDWRSTDGQSLRVYKTGDLARQHADGDLEYLGRIDQQVKIRGFRIELGEIESALERHPSVQASAVVARTEPGESDARLVAYVVPVAGTASQSVLRSFLAESLPSHMIPTAFVTLASLPLTENGKLDRRALPAPSNVRPDLAYEYERPEAGIETMLCNLYSELLAIHGVGRNDNFFDLGGDSLLAAQLVRRVQEALPREASGKLSTSVLFNCPTPATLASSLERRPRGRDRASQSRGQGQEADSALSEPIAIIAMAGRFPGAANVETFWRNLCNDLDSITIFAPGELDPAVSEQERNDPAYVMARGLIDDVDQFDAAFFGISPNEAQLMDPQQRILLELSWECIERAGYIPDATKVPVGVFAGMFNASYYQHHVSRRPDLIDKVGPFQVMLGNEKDFIATRIAHKLNLTGPAISIHTACSTSLVAVCQAVDSLRLGNCGMALAGGVTVTCPPRSGYRYQEGAMLSPDGHTRPFDAKAQGTVFSDGAAIVLLKRLSDALADGDQVFAVIRGGAVNNDGSGKASFTAPSSEGQAAVIAMAHDRAGVDPRSIGYVEAHGTATQVGDPIEIEGLTRAFRYGTDDCGFCHVGSVKSNVGHLVIAAGAAGLIKTALSLAEERIPATVNFSAPNPSIDFTRSPFRVNTKMCPWPRSEAPRRAGVSSFGVGGTNAHVVLEEAPLRAPSEPASGPQLLTLSARSPAALQHSAASLADHLEAHPFVNMADVAWTLASGRKGFSHRLAIVAREGTEAASQLRSKDVALSIARSRPAQPREVVFLFPGQGATYPGMGRGLYATDSEFRTALSECAYLLDDVLGCDIRKLMFSDDPDALLPTSIMQPATFAMEYALARMWIHRGITPWAMIGHSVGEFVAATIAGVFSLPDALRLVARRGVLMQAQPLGGMLSVRQSAEEVLARLPGDLSLAAENAPGASVVAGPLAALASFRKALESEGIACRTLQTSHAFHSHMMSPVLAPFLDELERLILSAPSLPVVSTCTGDWLDATDATSPGYWAQHLRRPVRFSPALVRVLDAPSRVLLEVGPRATLSTLARQHTEVQKLGIAVATTLSDDAAEEASFVRLAAAQMWTRGAGVDLPRFDERKVRRRIRLPTYPFERRRFWVDAAPLADSNAASNPAALRSENHVQQPQLINLRDAANTEPLDAGPANYSALTSQLLDLFEDASGIAISRDDTSVNFIQLGFDSLMLTQIANHLQKAYSTRVTLRQLMGDCANVERLAAHIAEELYNKDSEIESSSDVAISKSTTVPSIISGASGISRTSHDIEQSQHPLVASSYWRGAPDADAPGPQTIREERLQKVRQQQRGEAAVRPDTGPLRAPMDSTSPPIHGARLGRSPDGTPGWFVADRARPGKFLKVGT